MEFNDSLSIGMDDFSNNEEMEIPEVLPMMAVRDVVVFNYMIIPLFVGRPGSVEAVNEALGTNKLLMLVTQKDAIEMVVHRRPLELTVGDVIEQSPAHGSTAAHVADVMHADVPLVTVALVGVGVTASSIVLLEDAYAPAELGKQCGRRQAAHPGPYDDRVIGWCKTFGAVAITDT